MEKKQFMPMIFNDDDLEVMTRLRNAFNPHSVLNPQKLLPNPRTCREVLTPQYPGVVA
jgi:glycolate oxidase